MAGLNTIQMKYGRKLKKNNLHFFIKIWRFLSLHKLVEFIGKRNRIKATKTNTRKRILTDKETLQKTITFFEPDIRYIEQITKRDLNSLWY